MSGRSKNTIYEGGINVPLIVSGPLVAQPGSQCEALVSMSDLFASVAHMAGVDAAAALPGVTLDSTSIGPYFADPAQPSLRLFVYTESFEPVGSLGLSAVIADRAVRDERHKLIVRVAPIALGSSRPQEAAAAPATAGVVHPSSSLILELYDLQNDPFEELNLFSLGLTPSQWATLRSLSQQAQTLF